MDEAIHFTATIWRWKGAKAAWHFVSLPIHCAEQVKFFTGERKTKGWGAIPITATIGATRWQSSIFPDKETSSYLLPLKAEIRRKESLSEGDEITVSLIVAV